MVTALVLSLSVLLVLLTIMPAPMMSITLLALARIYLKFVPHPTAAIRLVPAIILQALALIRLNAAALSQHAAMALALAR